MYACMHAKTSIFCFSFTYVKKRKKEITFTIMLLNIVIIRFKLIARSNKYWTQHVNNIISFSYIPLPSIHKLLIPKITWKIKIKIKIMFEELETSKISSER